MAYHHGDLGNALLNEALRRVTEHEPRSIVGRQVALAAKVAPSAAYRYVASHGHFLAVVSRWAREAHLSHPRSSGRGSTNDRWRARLGS